MTNNSQQNADENKPPWTIDLDGIGAGQGREQQQSSWKEENVKIADVN